MSANPIWIAGYFSPVAGASPVWIAPGDGTVPSAVQSEIVSYYAPVAGATAVWIAGFFAPPPAAIGATPITISGWGGSGGGGPPPVTSVWSAADAAANGMTLSNGGLTVNVTAASLHNAWQILRGSISKTAGKLYVEFSTSTGMATTLHFGVADAGVNINSYLGDSIYSGGLNPIAGQIFISPGFSGLAISPTGTPAANDVWGLAVNFTDGYVWFARNNVWANGGTPGAETTPFAGVNPVLGFTPATVGALFPAMAFSTSGSNGTWTIQSTAASQKYAPPSGFSAWDGGAAPSHSAEALAYLARTVGGNEGGNGANITTLIDGLVSDGVWAKLDALYVLAQQNQTDALLNLVGTSYGLMSVGLLRSVTFTSYLGFSGFSTSVFLSTQFNASIATSPQFTQNSASFGFWTPAAITNESTPQIGNSATGATGESQIYDSYGGIFYTRVNNPSVPGVGIPGTKGLFVGDRPSSTTVTPYWNGTAQASQSSPSQALVNATFTVGAVPGVGGTGNTLCAAFIGASLGAAGQLALYNRLRTYMTAVGVP